MSVTKTIKASCVRRGGGGDRGPGERQTDASHRSQNMEGVERRFDGETMRGERENGGNS